MLRRLILRAAGCAFVVTSMGCGGGTAEPTLSGPFAARIVTGQNQIATAGDARLAEAIIVEVTAQVGQKVSNATMCVAESLPDGTAVQLVPNIRCTTTNTNGQATWVLTPPTRTGSYRAPIGGSVAGENVSADTVRATVSPDAFRYSRLDSGTTFFAGPNASSSSFPEYFGGGTCAIACDRFHNAVPFRIVVVTDGYGEVWEFINEQQGNRYRLEAVRLHAKTASEVLGAEGARTVVLDSVRGSDAVLNQVGTRPVCGTAQIVTAQGVSATGTFGSFSFAGGGSADVKVGPRVDLSARDRCP